MLKTYSSWLFVVTVIAEMLRLIAVDMTFDAVIAGRLHSDNLRRQKAYGN